MTGMASQISIFKGLKSISFLLCKEHLLASFFSISSQLSPGEKKEGERERERERERKKERKNQMHSQKGGNKVVKQCQTGHISEESSIQSIDSVERRDLTNEKKKVK